MQLLFEPLVVRVGVLVRGSVRILLDVALQPRLAGLLDLSWPPAAVRARLDATCLLMKREQSTHRRWVDFESVSQRFSSNSTALITRDDSLSQVDG
jgi:hypothetical protein